MRRQEGSNAWMFYLGALVLALIGLGQFNQYQRARRAEAGWTSATGYITGHYVRRSSGRGPHSYSTYVNYDYDVNGTMYAAQPVEVNQNDLYMGEDSAYGALAKDFPQGGSITVYYDPYHPSDSSLGSIGAPRLTGPIVFFLLAGMAVFLGKEQ